MIEHCDLIQLWLLQAQLAFGGLPSIATHRAALALANYRLALTEEGYDECWEVNTDPPWDWLNPPPSRRAQTLDGATSASRPA